MKRLVVLLVLLAAADAVQAQYRTFPRSVPRPTPQPIERPGYIDTSWQNNPYVYYNIHHRWPYPPNPPYPPRPPYPVPPWWWNQPVVVPYPVPMPYPVIDNPYGPTVVQNNYQPNAPTSTVLPPPSKTSATIAVLVPTTTAIVWVDGQKMKDDWANTRVFHSPDLDPSHDYFYTVKAQWVQLGSNVTQERQVTVKAGKTSVVDFTGGQK